MQDGKGSVRLSLKQLRQLLETHDLRSRDLFFTHGAHMLDASFAMLYNEELNAETYPKVAMNADGEWVQTTTPVGVLFAGDDYGLLALEDSAGRALLVGFDKQAKFDNVRWKALKQRYPLMPNVRGKLVFMRWQRPMNWTGDRAMSEVQQFYQALKNKRRHTWRFE